MQLQAELEAERERNLRLSARLQSSNVALKESAVCVCCVRVLCALLCMCVVCCVCVGTAPVCCERKGVGASAGGGLTRRAARA